MRHWLNRAIHRVRHCNHRRSRHHRGSPRVGFL
ncbi:Uncharacterised protein [Vibrio cholerae]|nr:Uncharacterised protein [Vibrio cholerae]